MPLYLDITDTFNNWSGSPTGIQRTLVELTLAARECPGVLLTAKDIEKPVWYNVPYEASSPSLNTRRHRRVLRKTSRMRPVGEPRKPRRFLSAAEIRIFYPSLSLRPLLRLFSHRFARSSESLRDGSSGKWFPRVSQKSGMNSIPRALPSRSKPRTQVLSTPLRTHENHLPYVRSTFVRTWTLCSSPLNTSTASIWFRPPSSLQGARCRDPIITFGKSPWIPIWSRTGGIFQSAF